MPREPFTTSVDDESHTEIAVLFLKLKIWCFLPYSKRIYNLIKEEKIHINHLEFIAIFLAFIIFQYIYHENPLKLSFPPYPLLDSKSDSISALTWWEKISTKSIIGQNLPRGYAE